MVHQGQRLPLLVEAGEHPLGVEAGANDLDGDAVLHRRGLVGDPDLAHAPFAELLAQFEAAGEDAFGQERRLVLPRGIGRAGVGAALEDAGGLVVGLEQPLDAPAEVVVAPARPVQKCAPLGPPGLAKAAAKIVSSLITPALYRCLLAPGSLGFRQQFFRFAQEALSRGGLGPARILHPLP